MENKIKETIVSEKATTVVESMVNNIDILHKQNDVFLEEFNELMKAYDSEGESSKLKELKILFQIIELNNQTINQAFKCANKAIQLLQEIK